MANLSFIRANLDRLDQHDLDKIEETLRRSLLMSALDDLHVTDRGEVACTGISVDVADPKAAEKFNREAVRRFGSLDTMRAYVHAGTVVRSECLRHESGDRYHLAGRYSVYPLRELLIAIDYVLTGTLHHDYAAIHTVMDDNGWKQYAYDDASFTIDYQGVRIKRFKNGRLDLRFGDATTAEQFRATIEQWSEFRKVTGSQW